FTGTITDAMCANGDHSRMRMGPTDAECTVACVQEHDAAYVLLDGTTVYELSDQRTPERFAAKRVSVVGTLDAKTRTIQVESSAATLSNTSVPGPPWQWPIPGTMNSASEFAAAGPTASLMRLNMIRLASGVTSGSAHP